MDFAPNFAWLVIVYMYTKTAEMKASGHFKMNKKQKKKDKTPGTIFDWGTHPFDSVGPSVNQLKYWTDLLALELPFKMNKTMNSFL